ncbi:MAG: 4Fe-4S binding protein, partial [Gemmatimonadota bacterium]
ESDSPRGRIVLMRSLARGTLSPTAPRLAYHLDRCLGCLACEPACPSDVRYGAALEATRAAMARSRPVPLVARLVNSVMADRRLWRPLFAMARLTRPATRAVSGQSRLAFAFGMLGATKNRRQWKHKRNKSHRGVSRSSVPSALTGSSATTVLLFTGCIMDGLFSHVHDATERTLAANGYRTVRIPRQRCCGALHAHTGDHDKAVELARANITAFADDCESVIAVNSAGCGAMLKEYGRLFAGDRLESEAIAFSGRVRDVSELLGQREIQTAQSWTLRVAYDPPCHLLHAQRIADAPRTLLATIPGLEIVQHDDAEMCCGSGGSYSLTEVQLSRAVLDQKVSSLLAADPDVIATGNPGCIMQIGAGLAAAGSRIPVVHPIELLDQSYAMSGFYDE